MHTYIYITMKLVITLLFAVSSVQGGLPPQQRTDDPAYMMWPGDDGKPHLAILRGPSPKAEFHPEEVTFHLYTQSNPDTAVQIFVGDMNGAPFDPSKPTKLIVHGFTSNAFTRWVVVMKSRYLNAADYNVIAVDWERPAQGPFYDNAKQRAHPTGLYLGEFLSFLASQGGNMANMHCIGHSLGAHVCGFAGESVGSALGRVTGMDPALPLYDYQDLPGRLDSGDAVFVDVIHTCGGFLAFWRPIGHADFYPNNGEASQPGCGLDLTGDCSHGRSHEYFEESISSNGFNAKLCDSMDNFNAGLCDNNEVQVMGEDCSSSASGSYFLETYGRSPYAMG